MLNNTQGLLEQYLVFSSLESTFPSALVLGPMEIALTVVMTFLTLGSIAIFLEDAIYLHKNTLCPIKRKTMIWTSSSPTVRVLLSSFGRDWKGGSDHFEDNSKQFMPEQSHLS
jgi:organic solute transporter subunit alpha